MRRRLFAPRAGVVAGAFGSALLCVVVAIQLAAGSERADLAVLCDGEARSGLPLRGDLGRVDGWIRAHLRVPRIGRAFAAIRDAPVRERGPRLRDLAVAAGRPSCRLADALDALADEAAYRAELQALCSYVTFPGLAGRDDAGRASAVGAWLGERAATPRLHALGAAFAAAPRSDRARLLKDVAREAGLWTCDVAKLLEPSPVAACFAHPTDGADAKSPAL
ncbi:MAG: hypothetical protein FWD17_02005 [Polyangiaceae bacterium]|nr:hypothetical protein [Polyangiaceae bacterium]